MKSQPWMLSLALPLKAMRLSWESVSMPIFGWKIPEARMATLISSRSFLTIQVISSSCSLPLMSSGLMSVRDSGGMWCRRASAACNFPSITAWTRLASRIWSQMSWMRPPFRTSPAIPAAALMRPAGEKPVGGPFIPGRTRPGPARTVVR